MKIENNRYINKYKIVEVVDIEDEFRGRGAQTIEKYYTVK